MATDQELETLAQWLETQGFATRKRHAITLTYLQTVCGTCTASQLRAICRVLLGRRGKPIKWLELKRIAHEAEAPSQADRRTA